MGPESESRDPGASVDTSSHIATAHLRKIPELCTYPEERLAISNENHSMSEVLKGKKNYEEKSN